MPRDVREYIILRHMSAAIAALKTPQDKREFVQRLMEGALGLENEQINLETRDKLIKIAFDLTEAEPPPLPGPPH